MDFLLLLTHFYTGIDAGPPIFSCQENDVLASLNVTHLRFVMELVVDRGSRCSSSSFCSFVLLVLLVLLVRTRCGSCYSWIRDPLG